MPYRNVLTAVELDNPNARVIRRAAALAQRCRARLTIATCIPDLRALYRGTEHRMHQSFDETLVDGAQQGIEALCSKARAVPQQTEVLRGDPDQAVVEYAQSAEVDLIVFGNHDRHGLAHYVGGFGLGLLHRAHCDLLAVNLAGERSGLDLPLVALGHDEHDARLLRRAGRLFQRDKIVAVHVVRPPWRESWSNMADAQQARQQIAAQIEADMQAELSDLKPPAVHVAFDTPSRGIDNAARSGAHDLIVMGSGRHSPLGWHLGSTAHNLLSRTQHDVLLVRPEERP